MFVQENHPPTLIAAIRFFMSIPEGDSYDLVGGPMGLMDASPGVTREDTEKMLQTWPVPEVRLIRGSTRDESDVLFNRGLGAHEQLELDVVHHDLCPNADGTSHDKYDSISAAW